MSSSLFAAFALAALLLQKRCSACVSSFFASNFRRVACALKVL